MAILNPEAESAAKQRELAEAGYKHVEGAPAPLPLDLPHFSLRDLRAAIPKHCFERSFTTSTYYMIKNLLTCAALFYAATYIDQTGYAAYLLWPVYWFFQGSYLTGIWVVAHECGHQAYCSSEVVNNMIGLVLHSALLVPYHSWRISHRKHHSNTGSCENDEVFLVERDARGSPLYQLYRIVYMLVVGWMPGYLFFNATGPTKYWGKSRSHFNPYSAIYSDRERWMIVLSDIFLVLMIGVLATLVYTFSFYTMLKFYVVPYFVVNAYLRVELAARRALHGRPLFGPYLDSVVHRIVDTHVCHHIFSKMPFYHCEEATNAIKPLLGKFYLKDDTPVPIAVWRSYTHCKFVEDDGKIVFYKNKLKVVAYCIGVHFINTIHTY
ncbi:Fatty acid desaturase domain [Phytophthora cactorum]|nr:Fatty acid desaturase domain [Phytophthora cactorum]